MVSATKHKVKMVRLILSDLDHTLLRQDGSVSDKQVHIAYLKAQPDDIRRNLETARQTRVDDKGNEVWFSMLCDYFNNSPYAVKCGLKGEDGLVRHWIHRQDLELRICEELFPDRCTVLPSKSYGEKDIDKL